MAGFSLQELLVEGFALPELLVEGLLVQELVDVLQAAEQVEGLRVLALLVEAWAALAPEQVAPSSALIPGKQVLETHLETLLEILSLSLRKK